jgi:hypothetical protein
LALRGKKKLKSFHPPHEKFGILDETKYTYENFSILHFIIPKYLAFYIQWETKHSLIPNFGLSLVTTDLAYHFG